MQVHGQLEADRSEGPGGVADASGGGGNEQVAFHHVRRVDQIQIHASSCAASGAYPFRAHPLLTRTAALTMPISAPQHRLTFTYKEVQNISLLLDVYPPAVNESTAFAHTECPVIVYFHGGGLTVGNKESWFPHWLHGTYDLLCAAALMTWHHPP